MRLDAAGKPVASLPIGGSRSFKWSPQEQNRISAPIDPHIPQGLDIFRVIENVNRIELMVAGGYPPAWITFLNVPAVYRMAIAVTGKETKPRSIKLRVDWKGQWNDFDVGLG